MATCIGAGWGLCLGLLLACAPTAQAQRPAAHATPRAAASTHGVVVRVVDGDSLWIQPAAGGAPMHVRLAGIDAPELCQDGGPEARRFLAELVAGHAVQLRVQAGRAGHDGFGRTLAQLSLDGADVNRRLVEEGHAWSHRYKWDRGPYIAQERMARALRRGLHRAGAAAVMPRDFRRLHGPCAGTGELKR